MLHLIQINLCHGLRNRFYAVKPTVQSRSFWKNDVISVLKRNISKVRSSRPKDQQNIFLQCNPWKICMGVSIGLGTKVYLSKNNNVYCKALPTKDRRSIKKDGEKFDWKRFIEYLWPHKWLLASAVASALAVAFLNIYIPAMLGVIVNVLANMKVNPNVDFIEEIKMPALELISLYAGQAAFTFLYIHLLSQVGEKVASQMKQDLFVSMLKQDMAFFDKERTGELVNRIPSAIILSRLIHDHAVGIVVAAAKSPHLLQEMWGWDLAGGLTVDIQDFKSSFKQTISGGLRAITQVVGSAASLLMISPQLTGLTLVCVPSVVIGGTFIGSLLRKLSKEAQAQVEKATLVAEESISNMRTVRAFAGEQHEASKFASECEKAANLNMELGLGIGLFQAGTNLFLNGMVLGTMFMGGHLMTSGAMTAGDVMAFLVNAQTVQRSVAQLSLLFGNVVKGLSAGGRVFEYINKKPEMDTSGKKVIKYHELFGDIEFKDVTFAYPTRPEATVLKNFNLRIPAGKTVAIVGTSGNGKSTIAALLERFYDVDAGTVTIDGVDIRSVDCDWLRGKAIGIISQEPLLFATTIEENIRYSKPDATKEQIYRAAQIANAHSFIQNFPDGYNTVVGERGVTLSGGQKQRIAIARAVLKEPPILVLDEATSALDSESEKVVQQALESACKGRTVLVIAHRLSTVINADLIVVLHKGNIVEMGNHDQLKKKKGLYWNLIKQQDQDEASRSI